MNERMNESINQSINQLSSIGQTKVAIVHWRAIMPLFIPIRWEGLMVFVNCLALVVILHSHVLVAIVTNEYCSALMVGHKHSWGLDLGVSLN